MARTTDTAGIRRRRVELDREFGTMAPYKPVAPVQVDAADPELMELRRRATMAGVPGWNPGHQSSV